MNLSHLCVFQPNLISTCSHILTANVSFPSKVMMDRLFSPNCMFSFSLSGPAFLNQGPCATTLGPQQVTSENGGGGGWPRHETTEVTGRNRCRKRTMWEEGWETQLSTDTQEILVPAKNPNEKSGNTNRVQKLHHHQQTNALPATLTSQSSPGFSLFLSHAFTPHLDPILYFYKLHLKSFCFPWQKRKVPHTVWSSLVKSALEMMDGIWDEVNQRFVCILCSPGCTGNHTHFLLGGISGLDSIGAKCFPGACQISVKNLLEVWKIWNGRLTKCWAICCTLFCFVFLTTPVPAPVGHFSKNEPLSQVSCDTLLLLASILGNTWQF